MPGTRHERGALNCARIIEDLHLPEIVGSGHVLLRATSMDRIYFCAVCTSRPDAPNGPAQWTSPRFVRFVAEGLPGHLLFLEIKKLFQPHFVKSKVE